MKRMIGIQNLGIILGLVSIWVHFAFADPLESERKQVFESYNNYYKALKETPKPTNADRDRLRKAYTEPAERAYGEGFTNWAKSTLNKYFTKSKRMKDVSAAEKKDIQDAIKNSKPTGGLQPSAKVGGLKTVKPGKAYEEPYREPTKADTVLDGSNIPGELVFSGSKGNSEEKFEPKEYEVIDGKEIPTSLEF